MPFKALSGSPGPGSSTWLKKDPACDRQQFSSKSQALTTSTKKAATPPAKSDSKKDTTGEGKPDKPGASGGGQDAKESCEQCKYVKCIKSLIKEKEAIIQAIKKVAAERNWGNIEKQGTDYIDLGELPSQEDRLEAIQANDDDKKTLWSDILAKIPSQIESDVKDNCKFAGSGVLEIHTDPLSCKIDEASKKSMDQAVPCKELSEYAYIHETYHASRCLERLRTKKVLLLTVWGEAKEELAAYGQEIQLLRVLLKKAEAKCRWLCRCDQQKYETAQDCTNNCHAHLGVCHIPVCVELDPKTGKWIPGKGRAF